MNNLIEQYPSNQPILITQQTLDFLRSRFEREVINPLFFTHLYPKPDDGIPAQQKIDEAVTRFETTVAESFEISNQYNI